jgi:hypothetical protein
VREIYILPHHSERCALIYFILFYFIKKKASLQRNHFTILDDDALLRELRCCLRFVEDSGNEWASRIFLSQAKLIQLLAQSVHEDSRVVYFTYIYSKMANLIFPRTLKLGECVYMLTSSRIGER